MSTYLYRAISLEYLDGEYNDDLIQWPGSVIGRQSGYLSRSSAVAAGKASGVPFKVVRSEPVVFVKDREIEAIIEADELRRQVAQLKAERRDAARDLADRRFYPLEAVNS